MRQRRESLGKLWSWVFRQSSTRLNENHRGAEGELPCSCRGEGSSNCRGCKGGKLKGSLEKGLYTGLETSSGIYETALEGTRPGAHMQSVDRESV